MTPETPYRLDQIERRIGQLERRIDEMKFDAVLVRVGDCREDIDSLGKRMESGFKAMDRRIGKIVWLLVGALISVTGASILIAVSLGVHP